MVVCHRPAGGGGQLCGVDLLPHPGGRGFQEIDASLEAAALYLDVHLRRFPPHEQDVPPYGKPPPPPEWKGKEWHDKPPPEWKGKNKVRQQTAA